MCVCICVCAFIYICIHKKERERERAGGLVRQIDKKRQADKYDKTNCNISSELLINFYLFILIVLN